MKTSHVLGVAVLALSLTACGAGSDKHPVADKTPSTSTPSIPVPTDTAVPAGMLRVSAPKAGVSFAIPDEWAVTTSSMFDNPKLQPALQKLATSQNITLDQLKEKVSRVEVVVTSPAGTATEDRGTISAGLVAGYTEVPTEDHLRSSFAAINATVDSVEKDPTPIGEATVVAFHEPLPTGGTVYGEVLYASVPNGVLSMSLARGSADNTASLAGEVVDSLRLL